MRLPGDEAWRPAIARPGPALAAGAMAQHEFQTVQGALDLFVGSQAVTS